MGHENKTSNDRQMMFGGTGLFLSNVTTDKSCATRLHPLITLGLGRHLTLTVSRSFGSQISFVAHQIKG
jgi:hypothetical protein